MRMFKPINEWILVRQVQEPAQEQDGPKIVLPENSTPDFMFGEVLDVGEGPFSQSGVRLPPAVKPGDKVYFTERGSQHIRDLGVWKTTDRAILGVVEDDEPPVPFA